MTKFRKKVLFLEVATTIVPVFFCMWPHMDTTYKAYLDPFSIL